MTDTTAIAVVEDNLPATLAPSDLTRQVALIQLVMAEVMHDGEHYGKIPGCGDKPTLLKPGAEKLAMTFRLAPQIDVERIDMPNGHRENIVRIKLASIPSGAFIGEGIGSCSTMESKYRYRNVADFEVTGEEIPKDSKERKSEYRRQGFGMKKVDGVWEWVKYLDAAKTENPDIADTYNTVLKMAKKRALVDAILTATGASDMFTQDIEDLPDSARKEAAAPTTPQQQVESTTEPQAPAEGTNVPKATAASLKAIRKLKADLGVSDEQYIVQLSVAMGQEVSDDSELTKPGAEKMLAAYERKATEAVKAALEAEGAEVVSE